MRHSPAGPLGGRSPQGGVAAIVLAAGDAGRMGSPKQLLLYAGTSLVSRAARAALESLCHPVYVVLGARAEQVGSALDGLDVRRLSNPYWADGLSSSIACGIAAAVANEAPRGVLLMLTDQPHVTSAVLDALVESFDGLPTSIVASGYGGGVGVPALFGADHFAALGQLEGDRGARSLLERHRASLRVIAFEAGAVDVDTPEDYEALCSDGACT